jgi:hypothetical protein
MTELGKIRLRIGIKIKLAPPPQIALIQNATTVPSKSNIILEIIGYKMSYLVRKIVIIKIIHR